MNTFLPTIGQPTDPTDNTAAAPSGTRVSFMPATGAGGIYDADQDALTVHSNPDTMSATPASFDMTGSLDIPQETRLLMGNLKAAQDRVAAATTPTAKAQAEQQLARVQERTTYGLQRLDALARSRQPK